MTAASCNYQLCDCNWGSCSAPTCKVTCLQPSRMMVANANTKSWRLHWTEWPKWLRWLAMGRYSNAQYRLQHSLSTSLALLDRWGYLGWHYPASVLSLSRCTGQTKARHRVQRGSMSRRENCMMDKTWAYTARKSNSRVTAIRRRDGSSKAALLWPRYDPLVV